VGGGVLGISWIGNQGNVRRKEPTEYEIEDEDAANGSPLWSRTKRWSEMMEDSTLLLE
jgi:hypothetical protein